MSGCPNQLALNFKSQSILIWDDINKTQAEKDRERVALSEQTLKKIQQQEQQHKDSYKAISDERIRLEQQLHEARKAKNQDAIDRAMAGLTTLSEKEKVYQKEHQTFADERIKTMQAWAESQVRMATENGSALTMIEKNTIKAKIQAQGLAVEFDKVGNVLVKALPAIEQAVSNSTKAMDDARKSASALDLDLDKSLNRVSEKFQANANHLDKLALGLADLGAKGEQVGNTMFEAWLKVLDGAKSLSELNLAKEKLQQFEKQGVFSTKQVELGLEAIRRANSKIPSELTETEKAFERLGIKTKEQLQLSAELALSDFKRVQQSGQATVEQLKQAYERVLQSAEASGNATVIANTKAQASIAGLKIETDSTGKSIVQSMNEANQAVQNVAETASNTAVKGFQSMAQSADETLEKMEQVIDKANQVNQQELGGKLGTTTNQYYSLEWIVNDLKNKGFDDAQAFTKAKELFNKASQQMMNWAGSNSVLRKQASNTITNHGVTMNALAKYLTQAGNDAVAMKAQQHMQSMSNHVVEQLQQVAPKLEQLDRSVPTTESVEKVVRFEFKAFGKNAELSGTAQNGDTLGSILSELEMIKRRS